MSREPGTIVLAPLKFTGLVEELCFKNLTDLFKYFEANGFAAVPTGITNVHVGVDQPTSTENEDVWFRLSNGGKFLGIYVYGGATWEQVYPVPGEVMWLHGDSGDVPTGFSLVDTGLDGWDAGEITAIQAMYYPAGPGPWTYFAVQYTGF